MLHQRDDIGEGFVKSQHVRIGRFIKLLVHPVQNCVRRFVRNDVMRKASVNSAARNVISGIAGRSLEVTKQEGDLHRTIEGVRLLHRVRPEGELTDEFRFAVQVTCSPQHAAAQRSFEVFDGFHSHRIDHLLMKLGIALGRRPAVLRQQFRIIQIDQERQIFPSDLEMFSFNSEVLTAEFFLFRFTGRGRW